MRALIIVAFAACSSAPVAHQVTPEPSPIAPSIEITPIAVIDAAPVDAAGADAGGNIARAPDDAERVIVMTSDCGLALDMIYFPDGSPLPATHQTPILDGTAAMFLCLERVGTVVVWEVRGHADAHEGDPLGLSDARAHAVVDELVKRGVNPATLTLQGYGATAPLDRRRTAFAQAKNRRVDFVIVRRTPSP